MTDPLLQVQSISHTYRDRNRATPALASVSFDVQAVEFVCVVGTSGSGKSTLLRILGGLLRPETGQVLFKGQPLQAPHPQIGFVFQNTNLMPWRTALENVLLPLELQKTQIALPRKTGANRLENARQRAHAALTLVGLAEFADAYPAQLSGGMAQRLTLARTLLQEPSLLLMDEPFGALDALTRERLNQELLRICQNQTVLIITHSIQEAIFLADRVLILGGQPGRVQDDIHIDLPRPRSLEMLAWPQAGALVNKIRDRCRRSEERGLRSQPSPLHHPAYN